MGTTPEELKQEIDQTRADLALTVDALAVKVTPSPRTKLVSIATMTALMVTVLALKVRRRQRRG